MSKLEMPTILTRREKERERVVVASRCSDRGIICCLLGDDTTLEADPSIPWSSSAQQCLKDAYVHNSALN